MKTDLGNSDLSANGVRNELRFVWPRRLGAQLVLLFSLMLIVSMTLFSYRMLREVVGYITSTMKMQSSVLANDISATGANFLLQRDYTSIEQMLLRSINFPGVIAIQVCDSQGKLLGDVSRSAGKSPEVHYGEPPLNVPVVTAASMQIDKTSMQVWQPVILGDLLGWVKITYSLQDVLDAEKSFWLTNAYAAGVIVLMALVSLTIFMRRPLSSIERYTKFAGMLDESQGEEIPVDRHSNELQKLGEALNSASARLEQQSKAVSDSISKLEELAAFPEGSQDIVISMNADAKVMYINPHGLKKLSALGLGQDKISSLLPDNYRKIVERCLSDGITVQAVETEFNQCALSWTFAPLLSQKLVHCYAQEITETRIAQKYAMNALVEKQAAQAANQAKSIFLANMSHEIRTPLSGVLGFLNLLSKTALTETQRDYLKTTEASAKMLLTVINDTLDFSKIEAGKISIEQIDIDLNGLLDEVISLHKANATNKGLKVVYIFDRGVPSRLLGDPARISQVVSNLLGNAIKFTHRGEILLRVSLKEETDDDALIVFSIKDSGIGISPEEQERLFMPFSQADASITRKYGGTGLGLVISKTLIELMGGEISVVSESGQGALFTFTLRLPKQGTTFQTEQSMATPIPKSLRLQSKENGGELSVLIVDDNEINRKLARILVEQLGATTDTAENGAQAVDACNRKAYGLILMDIHMPVMDGVEAATRIRDSEKNKRQHTIIVALTANALSSDRERYLAAGMDEYLSKPINETAFVNLMKKLGLTVDAAVSVTPSEKSSKVEESSDSVVGSGVADQTALPSLDPQMGIELSFGNRDTWRTVLGMLFDSLSEYSSSLISAKDDLKKLSQVAHKLAGASSYCGTPALNFRSRNLESLAKEGNLDMTARATGELLKEIERLMVLRNNRELLDSENPIF
jgi:signal transduction histidine kinase/FixJ family two-component response regulator/HPt (histidine-containing phosphotransfer) domain-containing protein